MNIQDVRVGIWYPIESAPKDKYILLYARNEILVGFWGNTEWNTIPGEFKVNPAYWMPLPSAPIETKTYSNIYSPPVTWMGSDPRSVFLPGFLITLITCLIITIYFIDSSRIDWDGVFFVYQITLGFNLFILIGFWIFEKLEKAEMKKGKNEKSN